MDVTRTPAETLPGPAENFTGAVWIDAVAVAAAPSTLRVLRVRFTPGARTAWHSHRNGQILHVIDGTGRVQARGGQVHEVRIGDSVVTAGGEWHWHGAGPGSFMTHLAIQAGEEGADPEWGEHVSDEDYLRPPG